MIARDRVRAGVLPGDWHSTRSGPPLVPGASGPASRAAEVELPCRVFSTRDRPSTASCRSAHRPADPPTRCRHGSEAHGLVVPVCRHGHEMRSAADIDARRVGVDAGNMHHRYIDLPRHRAPPCRKHNNVCFFGEICGNGPITSLTCTQVMPQLQTRCAGRPASVWHQGSRSGPGAQSSAGCGGTNRPARGPRLRHQSRVPAERRCPARWPQTPGPRRRHEKRHRFGLSLRPCRDVDTVAVDRAIKLLDHVAQVHADVKTPAVIIYYRIGKCLYLSLKRGGGVAVACPITGVPAKCLHSFEHSGRRASFHRPHPAKEALRYRVLAAREFLEKIGAIT